jgi:hypothetical protein
MICWFWLLLWVKTDDIVRSLLIAKFSRRSTAEFLMLDLQWILTPVVERGIPLRRGRDPQSTCQSRLTIDFHLESIIVFPSKAIGAPVKRRCVVQRTEKLSACTPVQG